MATSSVIRAAAHLDRSVAFTHCGRREGCRSGAQASPSTGNSLPLSTRQARPVALRSEPPSRARVLIKRRLMTSFGSLPLKHSCARIPEMKRGTIPAILAAAFVTGCCSPKSAAVRQWEYKLVDSAPFGSFSQQKLDEIAKQGWEIAGFSNTVDAGGGHYSEILLKRPKKSD